MVEIIIKNCNTCELNVSAKLGLKLYNEMSIRHPSAFYLKRSSKGWDGIVHFINKSGVFKIGLLPRVVNLCKSYGEKVKIIDLRKSIELPKKPVTSIDKFKLRPEQVKAISSILNNRIEGLPFHIGVIDYTVNAGKSLIMSALYLSFKSKLRTLLITNDSDWLNQARSEFKDYLPNEDITFVQGSNVTGWSNFSIGMVQSISRNIKRHCSEYTYKNPTQCYY